MGIELNHKMFDLEDIAIMTGNHVIPTASVKAKVNGEEHVFSSDGNGPVDAALHGYPGNHALTVSSSRSSTSRRSPGDRMPCAT